LVHLARGDEPLFVAHGERDCVVSYLERLGFSDDETLDLRTPVIVE
jgi:hypothetical protein